MFFFFLHCYLDRKLQLAFSARVFVYDALCFLPTFPSVFCCGWMWNLVVLFHEYNFLQAKTRVCFDVSNV